VGSRDQDHPYCSRVCCAYGLRLARLVRHRWPECEVTTFYMDLQNVGHDPENFQEACGREVHLIRALPGDAAVTVDGSLRLRYLDETSGRPLATEVDLLVLAVGIAPGPDTPRLAAMLDLELTPEGFLKPGEALNVTETPGIFLAGTAAGPKNILECIAEATQSVRQLCKYLEARA
jgi:heterodisulfide reductase subunit A